MTEAEWWASLSGDDLVLNAEGDPPYSEVRVVGFLLGRLGMGGRVLDAGCGTGRLTAAYDMLSGAEGVVGFDPSPNMLAVARERAPGVAFVDVLPDGPFDGAYSVTVLQHLPHDTCARLVRDVMARLRPGGRFCFQYVEGTEDAFLSHQADEATVRGWCDGWTTVVEPDPEFGEWRWVTVR